MNRQVYGQLWQLLHSFCYSLSIHLANHCGKPVNDSILSLKNAPSLSCLKYKQFWTWEAEACTSTIIISEIIYRFPYNFKLYQMQKVVSPNTVLVQLDQELYSNRSHAGVLKMIYYLQFKIGFTLFCFWGPEFMFLQADNVILYGWLQADKKKELWQICSFWPCHYNHCQQQLMTLEISDNCGNCGLMMIQLEHVTLHEE